MCTSEGAATAAATGGAHAACLANASTVATDTAPPCIVKVYSHPGRAFRLHTVVEVVGVLSIAPETTEFGAAESNKGPKNSGITASSTMDMMMSMDLGGGDGGGGGAGRDPPGSKVPRVHCLMHRVIGPVHEASTAGPWQFMQPAQQSPCLLYTSPSPRDS